MVQKVRGRLIGIAGVLGSGKTTMSNIMCSTGYWHRVRFAEDLKRITLMVCLKAGYPHDMATEMVDGCLKAVWNPELQMTPRRFQQLLGTEYRHIVEAYIRANPKKAGFTLVQDNLWLTSVQGRVDNLRSVEGKNVVIDDLRFFQTEGKWIKEEGGLCALVKSNRPPVQADMNTYRMIDRLTAREKNSFFRRNRESIIVDCISEVMCDERQPDYMRAFYSSDIARNLARKYYHDVLSGEFSEAQVEIQAPSLTHASEVSVSDEDVDVIIWNNSSVQDFRDYVMQFLATSDTVAINRRRKEGKG